MQVSYEKTSSRHDYLIQILNQNVKHVVFFAPIMKPTYQFVVINIFKLMHNLIMKQIRYLYRKCASLDVFVFLQNNINLIFLFWRKANIIITRQTSSQNLTLLQPNTVDDDHKILCKI